MNITRRGKIARLPAETRLQLNQRLRNGERGAELVKWLNSLPEVQAVIAAEFENQPVTEPNLTRWRQGGYAAWLDQQESVEMAAPVAADLRQMAQAAGGPVTDQMALWLSTRYVLATRKIANADVNDGSAWKRMREFCNDLVALRHGDHCVERLKFDREKLDSSRTNANLKTLAICLDMAKSNPAVLEGFPVGVNRPEHAQPMNCS